MKTLEQLNEMTDFLLRYEVANKLGISVCSNMADERLQVASPEGLIDYNPLINPAQYMPIAIEHGIDIRYSLGGDTVGCEGYKDEVEFVCSGILPKAQTGRAVCIAYLLMEPPKEID